MSSGAHTAGEHPAPQRHRLSAWRSLYALLGAPFAWFVLELAGWLLASHHCGQRASHIVSELTRATMMSFSVLALATLVIAIGSAVVAYSLWTAVRDEKPDSAHHLAELGEGRTRFVALVSVITSATFTCGLVFYLLELWFAPLCGS